MNPDIVTNDLNDDEWPKLPLLNPEDYFKQVINQ